jgi:transcriptional repressor NrdR
MRCPFCGGLDNKVIDSRLSQGDEVIRRRRECEGCDRRFTTYERLELVLPMVVKKDGRREPFDRLKVLAGLRRACEKRPVSTEALDQLVDRIERSLVEPGDKEVQSTAIGEQVMEGLRELDQVAYVRFASVYRSFRDIHEFMAELSHLLQQGKGDKP